MVTDPKSSQGVQASHAGTVAVLGPGAHICMSRPSPAFSLRASGAGLMLGKTVMANPGRRLLTGSEQGVVVGTSQEAVTSAMQVAYSRPPPLEQASADHEEAKTRMEVRCTSSVQLQCACAGSGRQYGMVQVERRTRAMLIGVMLGACLAFTPGSRSLCSVFGGLLAGVQKYRYRYWMFQIIRY